MKAVFLRHVLRLKPHYNCSPSSYLYSSVCNVLCHCWCYHFDHRNLWRCNLKFQKFEIMTMGRMKCVHLQHSTCNMQQATCNMPLATCYLQHATCNLQHATCNLQHATSHLQHATCNMQHATMFNYRRAPCYQPYP